MIGKTVLVAIVSLAMIALVMTPTASAQPDSQCMPVYQEINLGPITIVRPNSCSAYVVFNGTDPCEDWKPSIC